MNSAFASFTALSPRVAALSGAAYLTSRFLRLWLSQRFILDTVVELSGGLCLLVFLISAPFAMFHLWRKHASILRQVERPQAVKAIEWRTAAAGAVLSGTAIFTAGGAGMMRIFRAGARRLRPGVASAATAARSVEWRTKSRAPLRVAGGLSLTALQIVIALAGLTCAAIAIPSTQSWDRSDLVLLAGALAWPFVILALVAVQTRFNLYRLSTYSAALIHRFATGLFKASPFIALACVIMLGVAMGPESWGWMILIAPVLSVQIVLYGGA